MPGSSVADAPEQYPRWTGRRSFDLFLVQSDTLPSFQWEDGSMLKGIVAGFMLGVFILAGGAYYYLDSGMAPVATADPMMPFEKKMANMALRAHIAKQNIGESPVAADEAVVLIRYAGGG